MTIRDIAIAFGYEIDRTSEKKVEKNIASVKQMATKALGAIGIGFSLVKINALVEECQTVNQQIKTATKGLGNQKDAQNQVLQAAQNSRQTYREMAATVAGLMNTHNRLFTTVKGTTEFAEIANKAFKAAGANESVISSLNSALTAAFTTGKLSAGSFQTLMKECPVVVSYLSESLGISEQHVKALGTAGAITANQLYTAFTTNAGRISAAYDGLDMTVTDALKHIRNGFAVWLTQMNSALQLTQTLSKVMVRAYGSVIGVLKKVTAYAERLAQRLGGTNNLLKLITMTVGSLIVAVKGKAILAFLQSAKSLLSAAGVKIALVAAAVLTLALLVEDFVQFLNGNDSVFGDLFEKMGISAEDAKEKIREVFGQFQSFLPVLIDFMGEIVLLAAEFVAGVLPALVQFVADLMPMLGQIIDTVLPALTSLLSKLLPVVKEVVGKILPVVSSLLARLLPVITNLAGKILPPLLDIIGVIADAVLNIIDAVLPVVVDLLNAIIPIIETLLDCLSPVIGLVGELLSAVLSLLAEALKPVIEVVKILAEVLLNNLSLAFANITAVLKPVIDLLKISFGTAVRTITDAVRVFADFVTQTFGNIRQVLNGVIDFVAGVFTGDWNRAWEGVKNIFSGTWNQIKNVFSTVFDLFKGVGSNIIEGIKSGFKAALDGLKSAVTSIFDNIVSWFKNLFGIHSPSTVFKEFGIMMMQGLIEGLQGMLSPVLNVISGIGGKIKGAVTGIWEGAKSVAGKIGETVSDAASSAVNTAKGVAATVATGIAAAASAAADVVSGVKDKVGGAASAAASTVSAAAKEVWERLSRWLPFAEGGYVEPNHPIPAIVGDNKTEGEIISPVSKMRATVLDALRLFENARVPNRAASTIAQETSNRSLTQNVNIVNHFNGGTKEQQRDGAKAMKKSSEDATSYLARGLAYAR